MFTTTISGTGTNVRYCYQISKLVGGVVAATGFTTDRTYAFMPAAAGTYQVYVYAYDDTFNTVFSTSVTYVVK